MDSNRPPNNSSADPRETLKKYAQATSAYFTPKQGRTYILTYHGAEIVPHYLKKGVEIPRYHVEVDGARMVWDRAGKKLAEQMSEFLSGDILSLIRSGDGRETTYEIKKIDSKK